MKYNTYLPAKALQPYIENYWSLSLVEPSTETHEHCIVPDGNASLMFIQHPLLRRSASSDRADRYADQCLLIGQKSRPVFYSFTAGDRIQAYGVRFRPLGLQAFLRCDQDELTDRSIDAGVVFGKDVHGLAEAVLQNGTPQNLTHMLDGFFRKRLSVPAPQFRMMSTLLQRILRQQGQLKMSGLKAVANVSYRQMDRLFKSYLGLSPKAYARIVRFNYCVYLHRAGEFAKLTDLAYAGGFFDQMHFIKEVKFFTQQTPGRYFKRKAVMDQAFYDLLEQRFRMPDHYEYTSSYSISRS